MPSFLGKSLIKWSTIAVLGVSAYFLGYFWSGSKFAVQGAREAASETAPSLPQSLNSGLNKPGELSHLK
jgi:hypothetical protein